MPGRVTKSGIDGQLSDRAVTGLISRSFLHVRVWDEQAFPKALEMLTMAGLARMLPTSWLPSLSCLGIRDAASGGQH
jgi:hypothetical protein